MSRDLPPVLPAALDRVVLLRQLDGTFVYLGEPPRWFDSTFVYLGEPPRWFDSTLIRRGNAFDLSSTFDALAPFMEDAETVWRNREGHAASGTFVEADAMGRARPLYARAYCIENRALMTRSPPTHTLEQTQQLLQRARDEALATARTQRRVEEREVLLHCIVHDLSNPLQNLRSSLQLV